MAIKRVSKKITLTKKSETTDVSNRKSIKSKRVVFRSDSKQTATLIKVGRSGAANAIRASKALGLSITYLQNGTLFKEHSDGSKEIIKKVSLSENTNSKRVIKKGVILHAKK